MKPPNENMTSITPYLLQAGLDWIIDNGQTPYISVSTNQGVDGLVIPEQFIKDDQIILNLAASATQNFFMDKEWVAFDATFGGVHMSVSVPVCVITGIFSKETGAGIPFIIDVAPVVPAPPEPTQPKKKAPFLKVVK